MSEVALRDSDSSGREDKPAKQRHPSPECYLQPMRRIVVTPETSVCYVKRIWEDAEHPGPTVPAILKSSGPGTMRHGRGMSCLPRLVLPNHPEHILLRLCDLSKENRTLDATLQNLQ